MTMCINTRSWAALVVTAALGLSAPNAARAGEQLEVGGTGAALGTMRLLLDAFAEVRPGLTANVAPSLGSSGGIKALLGGGIDLAVSSRPPKDKERAAGATATIYGTTPIVFAVSTRNPATEVTTGQILDIYSGRRGNWPDGTPARLVLRPDGETDTKVIKQHVPGMGRVLEDRKENVAIPVAHTDQESAELLETLDGAIGTAALSLIVSERRRLKALAFNGVAPTAEAIADGSYPMTKSFYLVTSPKPSELVRSFLAFVRSPAGQSVLRRTGHLPVSG